MESVCTSHKFIDNFLIDVGYNNNVRYLFYGTRVRIYPTYIKTEDLTMDETCVKICLLCF
jgi:hypothetical protein